jgi:hypothetical protein
VTTALSNASDSPDALDFASLSQLVDEPPVSTRSGIGTDPRVYYRYLLENGSELNGVSDASGRIIEFLPPNTAFDLFIYKPSTNKSEIVTGVTGPSGSTSKETTLVDQQGGLDSDQDGIPDIGEFVIGTSITKANSDSDGIADAAEIEQGLDPLGGFGLPIGVVASTTLNGQATSCRHRWIDRGRNATYSLCCNR